MLYIHICMHRQKIIVSAAELAVRPPIRPCWKLSYLVWKVPKKVQVLKYSTGINRNVLARLPCLALPCLAPGYIPDLTLGRYPKSKVRLGKIEIKKKKTEARILGTWM